MEMKNISVNLIDDLVVIEQFDHYSSAKIKITPEQVSLLIDFLYQTVESIQSKDDLNAQP